MKSLRRIVVAVFWLAFAGSGAGLAGAQDTAFNSDLEVRLVNVDVVVEDKDGRPLKELTREDFELFVDGEPVEILHFLAPTQLAPLAPTPTSSAPAGEPQEGTPEDDPEERLNLVVLVDHAYLSPGEAEVLLPDLQAIVDRTLRPSDRVLLVRADQRVDVVRPLAPPPVDLAGLFATVEAGAGMGRGKRIRDQYSHVLDMINEQMAPGRFNITHADELNLTTRTVVQHIEEYAVAATADVEKTVYQLQFLATALAALPGRHAVLYATGRMPMTPGTALIDAWRNAYSTLRATARELQDATGQSVNTQAPTSYTLDTAPILKQGDHAPELFAALAREASARDIAFYTFDATSKRQTIWRAMRGSSGALDLRAPERWDFQASQQVSHQSVMRDLARLTGGRTMAGKEEDVEAVVESLRESRAASYEIAFVPPAPPEASPEAPPAAGPPVDIHEIELRLRPARGRKAKDVELRYRRHFRRRIPDLEAADRTISAVLLAGEVQDPADFSNPLEVSIELGERESREDLRRQITVKVPIARLGLSAEERAHAGQLSVFWTSGSFSGGTRPVMKAVVPIRIRNDQLLAAFSQQVEYVLEAELPADARAIAVTVRDDLADELGTVVRELATLP